VKRNIKDLIIALIVSVIGIFFGLILFFHYIEKIADPQKKFELLATGSLALTSIMVVLFIYILTELNKIKKK
jgi:hypothetical protein